MVFFFLAHPHRHGPRNILVSNFRMPLHNCQPQIQSPVNSHFCMHRLSGTAHFLCFVGIWPTTSTESATSVMVYLIMWLPLCRIGIDYLQTRSPIGPDSVSCVPAWHDALNNRTIISSMFAFCSKLDCCSHRGQDYFVRDGSVIWPWQNTRNGALTHSIFTVAVTLGGLVSFVVHNKVLSLTPWFTMLISLSVYNHRSHIWLITLQSCCCFRENKPSSHGCIVQYGESIYFPNNFEMSVRFSLWFYLILIVNSPNKTNETIVMHEQMTNKSAIT